ncbi:MAG: PEP-CTERM sorting domain-containing protein [Lentisphaeria bacterium]
MLYRTLSVLMGMIALVLTAGSAAAGIIGTYVDATMANTTPSSAFSVVESDTDNLWYLSTGRSYCRDGNVMVTQSGMETAPMLTTTVSDLANGVYRVYAVYWTHTSQSWAINAALAGGATVACNRYVGTPTGNVADGDKKEFYILLGETTVTDHSFFVNVVEREGYSRGWYDGLSYEMVPEPSVMALVLTGLLGLLSRCRRECGRPLRRQRYRVRVNP